MAKVFVITGPSGVGKGTLISKLLSERDDFVLSVSATTRKPRTVEVEGRDYFFLNQEQFQRKIDDGDFLEHASYLGNNYGTPKSAVLDSLKLGKNVLLEIELAGARLVKKSMPEAVTIFIKPPSMEDLRVRLSERNTDSDEQIKGRLETALTEIGAESEFDHVVVNDDLNSCFKQLVETINGTLRG